jgi:hypothetical protein
MMFRTLLREETALRLRGLGRWHKVFCARQPVTTRDDLPYIKVWTPDDTNTNEAEHPPYFVSSCGLNIQIVVEGVEDEANARLVDDMCEAVIHHLLEDGASEQGYVRHFTKVDDIATTIESNTEGEMRTVSATMIWNCQYRWVLETRIIDRLDRINTRTLVPDQPEPPPGGKKTTIDTPIEFQAPGFGHTREPVFNRPRERVRP